MADSQRIGGHYGDVRANIDIDSLNKYLSREVERVRSPVHVKQFKFGQSNPTYFLTDTTGARFVLRKKPAGQLLSPTAHAIEREYRVLRAIHKHNQLPSTSPDARVPIPEPIALCETNAVIGTPFYIMEFLDGRIFEDPRLPEVSPKERRELWLAAIRALASLSNLSPIKLGLDNFGPSTPYFPRQLKAMTKVSIAQSQAVDVDTGKAVGLLPDFENMIEAYKSCFPDESKMGTRIVHGDYKMDNVIFHRTEPRIIGILDWELCTLGSPLADLANLTIPFLVQVNDKSPQFPTGIPGLRGLPSSELPVTLEELQLEYCRHTNQPYPIDGATYSSSWMIFRLGIIVQGIAARYARRQASSAIAQQQGARFPNFGLLAKKILLENTQTTNASRDIGNSRAIVTGIAKL